MALSYVFRVEITTTFLNIAIHVTCKTWHQVEGRCILFFVLYLNTIYTKYLYMYIYMCIYIYIYISFDTI